ncbi:MAG TPA: protein TolB [Anaeromyxobacteraceae bacterium]|nr:protein TolB [Anaeromyxobacteraceae bacterium]
MRVAFLALLLAPAAQAQPRQYIDVGSPDFRPLPVAIAPLQTDAEARAAATEIAEVLTSDLTLSGIFDVLDPRSFLADLAEGLVASQIRFARWADVGAEGLVKGKVRRGPGGLSAEMHLFEVRPGREALFRTVEDRSPRAIAHRFADDLVQYYTREPGVFRTRIAALRRVAAGREIALFDVDGHGAAVAYREPFLLALPAWRPDGAGMLVTSWRGGSPAIWALDLARGAVRTAVTLGDLTTGGTFSPDGRRIAFTASERGNSDVWVANADGSGARRLTTDPATDTSPTWSPDGRRIAFVSDRAGTPQIYVMDADGGRQKRLTFQGNYNQTPRWSPRGDLIAFTARDERRVFDVFTISPETGKIGRVTQDQGFTNEEPSWAPNGRLLVFASDRNRAPQLVVSTPDGSRQRVITADPAGLAQPAWGPLPR